MRIALVLLALCSVCLGRVGEKYAEFKKRVGVAPTTETDYRNGLIEAFYAKDGVTVIVSVANGVISSESYSPVTSDQAKAIMQKQGAGFVLSPENAPSGGLAWSDDARTTYAIFKGDALMIADHKDGPLRKEIEAKKKAESLKKVDGF